MCFRVESGNVDDKMFFCHQHLCTLLSPHGLWYGSNQSPSAGRESTKINNRTPSCMREHGRRPERNLRHMPRIQDGSCCWLVSSSWTTGRRQRRPIVHDWGNQHLNKKIQFLIQDCVTPSFHINNGRCSRCWWKGMGSHSVFFLYVLPQPPLKCS